eukprot:TRINITY_DN31596_c0_g1_i1.p2 TRINITY_DN31596_c0_g1~~TRINITY_DN31596_c0_g1_i1.p2  ORF type:complete len:126 (+),score=11.48 TRINITY_DN31596_c0_g1_i1:244-621(+)
MRAVGKAQDRKLLRLPAPRPTMSSSAGPPVLEVAASATAEPSRCRVFRNLPVYFGKFVGRRPGPTRFEQRLGLHEMVTLGKLEPSHHDRISNQALVDVHRAGQIGKRAADHPWQIRFEMMLRNSS